jgi:hypothetical protein
MNGATDWIKEERQLFFFDLPLSFCLFVHRGSEVPN